MIRIAPEHRQQISAHAEDAYPAECCGLLAGRVQENGDIHVTRIVPSANVAAASGNDRFEVDPKVRFDLMRALAETDESIVGHYHSHPDQAAEPSATDVSMAFEPDLVWLIVPVPAGTAGSLRAWRLNRDAASIEALAIDAGEST